MTERVPLSRNALAPEVFLGGKRIVRRAAQGQVGRDVGSAPCERLQVVKLEVVRLAATFTARIDVSAASTVALEHCASFGRGDVSTPAPARR
jgi:hypothetical protein